MLKEVRSLLGSRLHCLSGSSRSAFIAPRPCPSAGFLAPAPKQSIRHTPRLFSATRGFAVAAQAAMAATTTAAPSTAMKRLDYKPTPFLIDQVHLDFVLGEESSTVTSSLSFVKNPASPAGASTDVVLNAREDMKVSWVKLDGKILDAGSYEVTPKTLTISNPPSTEFKVEIETVIEPQNNTLLEGLYKSDGNYCTQCEAEGFRGITPMFDRPDVMSIYTTRIEADKAKYPVLLSNGNLIEEGSVGDGRHFAIWNDPFRKPCYLFAMVAGNLAVSDDVFTTMSGRKIKLRIFSEEKNISTGKVDWAMLSLKKAMKWDEDTFGLEYDLDVFHIVAVSSFNMGAMENKGLNIFNDRLVLASPETSTDGDYMRIEAVVAHEYFHNWTGNRVTCRDWFQLTLKEGLTVFRDHEFSSDMNSRAVRRIDDVMILRSSQFSEDAGPMAHPVRPDEVKVFDNFYSMTVYEKGSEVVRLYDTILGKAGFRKGMDTYFQRHDGQAVTCDDFLSAMADANGEDLSSLGRWYSQAGTPRLTVTTSYDAASQLYTLHFAQLTPPTAGQPPKQAVLIPVSMGLLAPDGKEIELKLQGSTASLGTSTVLRVTEAEQSFTFEGVTAAPVPSLLRGFSAPVKMTIVGQTDADLALLLANDTDLFNRWDASQLLAKKLLLSLYTTASGLEGTATERAAKAGGASPELISAFMAVLTEEGSDGAFLAAAVSLPSGSELLADIAASGDGADPLLLHAVRKSVVKDLALKLRPQFEAVVAANEDPAGQAYSPDFSSAARRAVKAKALGYLASLGDSKVSAGLLTRYRASSNMTDQISCLGALNDNPGPEREAALSEFYEQWKNDELVVLKWLSLSACSDVAGNRAAVDQLLVHPAFDITKPNCCYATYLGFARSPVNFHAEDGSGYQWLADSVLKVDKVNRQVAARMVSAFNSWRNYDPKRRDLVVAQLRRIVATEGLSANVAEIASKSLPAEA